METEALGVQTPQKPQVFLKSITFNDGTILPLKHSSIVVFTGANNSGKSQVLKDMERCLSKSNQIPAIVIKNTEYDYCGAIDSDEFIKERFTVNAEGYYNLFESGNSFTKNNLQQFWQSQTLYNGLHMLFVKLLNTEFRLMSSNALNRSSQPEKHPIYKLNKSEAIAQKLSDYFRQAFGVDLIVNRNEMQTIPLHTGQSPDKTAFTIAKQDDYYDRVAMLPKLQEQGDGMRSFASILLDIFTSDHTITLIDEPEAFLHPPQARLLGKMLAKSNPNERQLFTSTHSEDFLQGLLDADNENVTVIRINRNNNINQMSVLQNNEIKKLWSNPLLRYTNILSGLFHEKVIVCESDYDCLFYRAILDAIFEINGKTAPDIMFTHCGGKDRMKDVVAALCALDVPVVAIPDFDIIDNSATLKALASAFGIDWSAVSENMDKVYACLNANDGKIRKVIKKNGYSVFEGEAPSAYNAVNDIFNAAGLFIVPVGEIESFDKTIFKDKKEWVYAILERGELSNEANLETARTFVKSIVKYRSPSITEETPTAGEPDPFSPRAVS
ncbi:MAG: ATP-binding protein [Oscillospiraceae bacterium]|jgi:AAA15 family ATPase/GTPase|nr:ATP-binding protein [Oscillospiraceae bacterium]